MRRLARVSRQMLLQRAGAVHRASEAIGHAPISVPTAVSKKTGAIASWITGKCR